DVDDLDVEQGRQLADVAGAAAQTVDDPQALRVRQRPEGTRAAVRVQRFAFAHGVTGRSTWWTDTPARQPQHPLCAAPGPTPLSPGSGTAQGPGPRAPARGRAAAAPALVPPPQPGNEPGKRTCLP